MCIPDPIELPKPMQELVDAYFGQDDVSRATMADDEMREFIEGAERFEYTEPDSEYVLICYRLDDMVFVYDVARKPGAGD